LSNLSVHFYIAKTAGTTNKLSIPPAKNNKKQQKSIAIVQYKHILLLFYLPSTHTTMTPTLVECTQEPIFWVRWIVSCLITTLAVHLMHKPKKIKHNNTVLSADLFLCARSKGNIDQQTDGI